MRRSVTQGGRSHGLLAWSLVAAFAAACSDSGTPSTTDAGADTGSPDTGASDTGLDRPVTPDALDVFDAAETAPSDTGTDAVDAQDVPRVCTTNADCAGDPRGGACHVPSGACVQCVASTDTCPASQHCDDASHTCVAGCRSDEGCSGGDAGVPDAGAGLTRCDTTTHACVACVTDAHCGAGQLCVGSVCVAGCNPSRPCPTGQSCCSGACVDPLVNVAHCGACDQRCAAPNGMPACMNGTCAVGACTAPFADCDRAAANGCEVNTLTDTAHCGGCGMACAARAHASASCAAGTCAWSCDTGWADCDGVASNGCETDTTADAAHCGACRAACDLANATPACTAGRCTVGTCREGYGDCDGNAANGCETDTRTAVSHCGRCANACPSRAHAVPACTAGACAAVCVAGYGECNGDPADGCETDTTATVAHCGSCGRGCSAPVGGTATCVAGACGSVCPEGQTLCDGTCRVTGGSCTVGVGACARTGVVVCSGSDTRCGATEGTPSAEVCNGLDDNCNGTTDDGAPGAGVPCTGGVSFPTDPPQGACHTGTTVCRGTMGNVCDGAVGPSSEVCDGVDNDCDGMTDEGLVPGSGVPCGISLGECRPGTITCTGGSLRCTGGVTPTAEVCNGLDDDCNGTTDDGAPGAGVPCTGGMSFPTDPPVGACHTGTTVCRGTMGNVCEGAVGPSSEICDGVDNDCDGRTDEGVAAITSNVVMSELDVATAALAPTADVTLDTTTGAISGGLRAAGTGVVSGIGFRTVAQTGGPTLGVFTVTGLTVPAGVTLSATGANLLVIVASGACGVQGVIDVRGASGTTGTTETTARPGGVGRAGGGNGGQGSGDGSNAMTAGTGTGAGGAAVAAYHYGNGGGGGGYGAGGGGGGTDACGANGTATAAGTGGSGPYGDRGGHGGGPYGTATLIPLRAGSGGGGGSIDTDNGPADGAAGGGGAGGGAVQLSCAGELVVGTSGVIRAYGGDGGNGNSGAGGGGSGGAVLLEACRVSVTGAIEAWGGRGGGGYRHISSAASGGVRGGIDRTGGGGQGCALGSAGGGAEGRVRVNAGVSGGATLTGSVRPAASVSP